MSSGSLRSVASTALRQLSKPLLGVVVLVDVAAVDDQALGADLGGRVDVLLQELAARDPDPVVGGGDVDDVGRVDVEVDPRLLGGLPQRRGAPGVPDLGTLVGLRVAEEELHERRLAGLGLGDRVGLVDVRADADAHGGQASRARGRSGRARRPTTTAHATSTARPADDRAGPAPPGGRRTPAPARPVVRRVVRAPPGSGGQPVGHLRTGLGGDVEAAQQPQGGLGGGEPLLGVDDEEALEEGAQPAGPDRALARRGQAGEQLQPDAAHGVQVLAGVRRRPPRLLGGHVAVGADGPGDRGEAPVGDRGGHPEVAQPQDRVARAGGVEEQVGRLDVAVHQPGRVHRGQGHEQLLQQPGRVTLRQRAVLVEQLLDRPARHEVHGQQDEVVLGGPAGGGHHVRVPHPDRLLAHEAGQQAGGVPAQHLDRHQLPGAHVGGPPHRAHPAGPDLVEQGVAPGDGRAGRPDPGIGTRTGAAAGAAVGGHDADASDVRRSVPPVLHRRAGHGLPGPGAPLLALPVAPYRWGHPPATERPWPLESEGGSHA